MKLKNAISDDVLLKDIFSAKIALIEPDRQKLKGSCLSDQNIAALIDKRLDPESYNKLLEHIDSCDFCYMRWVDTFTFTQEPHQNRYKFKKEFIKGMASLAAIILIYILIPVSNTQNDPLQHSFDIALQNNIIFENLMLNTKSSFEDQIEGYIAEWQNNTNKYQSISYEKKAFAAGLYSALQPQSGSKNLGQYPSFIDSNLINKINQKDSYLSVFYHLGRWCLFIKAFTDSTIEIPSELWKEQSIFINNMTNRIETNNNILEQDKNSILKAFKAINARLDKIQQNLSNLETRYLISNEIEQFITFMLTELS